METGELLRNLREIVREETALTIDHFMQQMNARFDHVDTLFEGVFARLDRIDSTTASIKSGVST
jgi:hypothetical protein